jgi:hypothetical protein
MSIKLFRNVDYSSPLFFKKIERDNQHMYRRLFDIYLRKVHVSKLSKEHRYRQAEFNKSKNKDRLSQQREIRQQNEKVYARVENAKPTEGLTVHACDKHWYQFLEYKRRRCMSKRAAILNSY